MSRYDKTSVDRLEISTKYKDRRGTISKYNTTIYKGVEEKDSDIYLIAQEGDRLDNLAFEYYGDQRLWWFLANVNNLSSMNVPAGTSLRVPISTEDATEV